MASDLYDDFLADEGDECASCGHVFKQDEPMFGRPWGRVSWRFYCSPACAADNFRSPGQRFADRVLARSKGLKGLAGSITDIEKCPTCGKMVPSDRMAEHASAFHPAPRNETHAEGVSRIMRIFAEVEHLQTHNNPDCPDCKRIGAGVVTMRPVRSKHVALKSGAVTIIGNRQKPYNENAWVYTVFVVRDVEGPREVIGSFDTRKNKQSNGYYFSWWHNDGPGYDEGGNNRAAFLLHTLLRDGTISPYDIEGTRDIPLYRVKSSDDIEDGP